MSDASQHFPSGDAIESERESAAPTENALQSGPGDVGELETSAARGALGDRSVPAVSGHDLVHNRRPKPVPIRVGGVAVPEDCIPFDGRNTGAVVGDAEAVAEIADGDGDVVTTVDDGVGEEVLQDLREPWAVGLAGPGGLDDECGVPGCDGLPAFGREVGEVPGTCRR